MYHVPAHYDHDDESQRISLRVLYNACIHVTRSLVKTSNWSIYVHLYRLLSTDLRFLNVFAYYYALITHYLSHLEIGKMTDHRIFSRSELDRHGMRQ